jgi:hypothetical protein
MSKVTIRGVAFIGDGSRELLRAVEIQVDMLEGGDLDDEIASVSMTTNASLRKLPPDVEAAAAELLLKVG